MLNYKQYIKMLNEEETHSYGCVMAFFDNNKWNSILNIIDTSDLVDSGLETEAHVTILYGLHDDINEGKLINLLKRQTNLRIKIDTINLFENEKYDVVKFEIDNSLMHSLNNELKQFENTNNFPNYTPHLTIAYVKKGRGIKYVGKLKEPIYITSEYFVYSKKTGEKIKIVI